MSLVVPVALGERSYDIHIGGAGLDLGSRDETDAV